MLGLKGSLKGSKLWRAVGAAFKRYLPLSTVQGSKALSSGTAPAQSILEARRGGSSWWGDGGGRENNAQEQDRRAEHSELSE